MALKFALAGAQGRMGVAIREVLASDSDAQFGLGIVRSLSGTVSDLSGTVSYLSDTVRSLSGSGCGEKDQGGSWATSDELNGDPVRVLAGIDVVIDFSTPENLSTVIGAAVKAGMPLLVGVTGLGDKEIGLLKGAAEFIPVAYAANTSLGIAVLSSLCEAAARMLPCSFDVEILELHHKHKKDAPSGTALHLAGKVTEGSPERFLGANLASEAAVRVGRREGTEIGMSVARGGDVVGEHTVYFMGDGERLELTHRCSDRRVFARGAVYLAKRLKRKDPGFYSVAELIG